MGQNNERISLLKKFNKTKINSKISDSSDWFRRNSLVISVLTHPLNYNESEELENKMFNPLDTIQFPFSTFINNDSLTFIECKNTNSDKFAQLDIVNECSIYLKSESIKNIPINIKPSYLLKLLRENNYIEISEEKSGTYTFTNSNKKDNVSDTLIQFNWEGRIIHYRFDSCCSKEIDFRF